MNRRFPNRKLSGFIDDRFIKKWHFPKDMRHKDDGMDNRILMVEPVVFVGMCNNLPKREQLKILRQRLQEMGQQRDG